jgi:predicted hydrocarbon binding protein
LRKDVNVYLFNPTKKFFHVVIELENVPGALRNVLEVVHGLDLNVLGSFSSVDSSAKFGVWSGFVEDSDHTAMDLKRMLSASPYVHDAIVAESNKGFLVDGIHFPLSYNNGTRAVMMGTKALANMIGTLNERFGTGGEVILYEEGLSYGKEVGGEYLMMLGSDFISSNMGEVMKVYQAKGWFRVEDVTMDAAKGRVVIAAGENFECAGVEARSPHSHYVRGHLEGLVTTWLGRPMECRETLCVASGDRFCEFTLTPRA